MTCESGRLEPFLGAENKITARRGGDFRKRDTSIELDDFPLPKDISAIAFVHADGRMDEQ